MSAAAAPVRTITLAQAIDLALADNRALRHSTLGVAADASDVETAALAFALRVQPVAGFTAQRDESFVSYGVTAEQQARAGTTLSAGVTRSEGRLATGDPFQVDRIRLELRQPLFRNAGRLATTAPLAAATDAWMRAQRNHEIRRADLALRVVRQYEEVQRLRRQVELTEKAMQRRAAHHRTTRARERAGRTRRLDTLRAELLVRQAEARVENERERLASAERLFGELLGAAPGTRFELVTRTRAVHHEIDIQDALETALGNRLERAQAAQDRVSARRELRLAERRSLPDLSVFVRVQQFADAPTPVEVATFGASGVAVGVSGSFDGTPRQARIAAQRAGQRLNAAVESEHIAREMISREVMDALQAYRRAFAEAELASGDLALARRRLELANRLFTIGRSDSFSVGEAEEAFFAAETRSLALHAETMVRTYALAHATGTLLEAPAFLSQPEGHAE